MQVDLCAEEMGNNVRPAVALLGDIGAVVAQVRTHAVWQLICALFINLSNCQSEDLPPLDQLCTINYPKTQQIPRVDL